MKKLFFLLLIFLSGCIHDHFTVFSNKQVDISHFTLDTSARGNYIRKKDWMRIFVFVPVGNARLTDASESVFKVTDSNMLVDAEVKNVFWMIPYAYGQEYWSLSGYEAK